MKEMTANQSPGWVLVTGASRGIGRAIAQNLAEAGYHLILWARTRRDLDGARRELSQHGGQVRVWAVDVADAAAVDTAAGDSFRGLTALRGVVANAGGGVWSTIDQTPLHEWRAVLGPNLDGAFHTLRVAIPLLRAHPTAQIIGLASDSSYYPFAQRGAYCASKAGFLSLLGTARRELRPHGVRVTAVVPSRVDSYFRGKQPGSRPEAMSLAEIATVVGTLFHLPPRVEIREIQLSTLSTTFGPYPELFTEELAPISHVNGPRTEPP
jgi:NAD(P)-dependent dehydrogenase (short-subunit alcohol dehydrogenase family)